MVVRSLPPDRRAPPRPLQRLNDPQNGTSTTSVISPTSSLDDDSLPPPPPSMEDEESDSFNTLQSISLSSEGQPLRPLVTVDFTPRQAGANRNGGAAFSFASQGNASPEKGKIFPSMIPSRAPFSVVASVYATTPSSIGSSSSSTSESFSVSSSPRTSIVSISEEKYERSLLSPTSPHVSEKPQFIPRTVNVEDHFGAGAQMFRAMTLDVRGYTALEPGVKYYVRTPVPIPTEETIWADLKAAGLSELVGDPDLTLTPSELPYADIADFAAVLDKLSVSKKIRFRKWLAEAKRTELWTLVAAETDSSEKEAQFFLEQAIVYQQAHNLSAAVTLFEQAVTTKPTFVLAQFSLAKCLVQLKQYTSAASRFSQVIKLDENHSEAHLALGLLFMAHLERPTSEYVACFNQALQHPERLSSDSHNQVLFCLSQAYCTLSQFEDATNTLNWLKERPSTIPQAQITALTQQIANKQSMPTAGASSGFATTNGYVSVKRGSLPTVISSIDAHSYDEDSLHSIFLKMSSASPKNVICRNLLKLSLKMTELTNDSWLADSIRMQHLHDELGSDIDTWICSCDSKNVRISGHSLGNGCPTLAAKCFLYCGGKDMLLKMWNRSLRRTTSRRASMLPPPSDHNASRESSKKATMLSKIKRTSLSLPHAPQIPSDSDISDYDEENSAYASSRAASTVALSPQVREPLLDLLIQVWVLRLLWRFGEMSRSDCLTKCTGQLANQVFVAKLEGVEVVIDAKGKKRARYDISVDTRFKKWRVGKKYKEIQEFHTSLTQAISGNKHLKSFKLLPVPAKTFGQNSSSDKSKQVISAFLEDFTSPAKYQTFVAEASQAALNLVDTFFCVNSNQYYQMLSRTVFAECLLNAIKQCSDAEAQLSSGLLLVMFEIMVNEQVDARLPISEDNLPRLRKDLMPIIEVGWKTSALFHTKNSLIAESFVLPLIFDMFRCLPVGAINGGLEYLTMLLVRNAANCILFFPSLTPGSMSSSGWKAWLSYFIPNCFAWKTMDDGKTPNDDLIRDHQHSFQLSLNITIMSIHHAVLTSTIPSHEAFSVASVLISIIRTVVCYRIEDILNPAPVVVEQPERNPLSVPLTLESDSTSIIVLRTLLDGLLHKVTSSVGKFRNDHSHPGWTNLFQFLSVIQRLVVCNPAEESSTARIRTASLHQSGDASIKLPKSQSSLGSVSPRKHSRQMTEGSAVKLKELYATKDFDLTTIQEPVHSHLVGQTTLHLISELLSALKVTDIDTCITFGMQPAEEAQVQAHRKQGLVFLDFFKKIGALAPLEESESDDEYQGEVAPRKREIVLDQVRGSSTAITDARDRALEFLERGGDLIVLIQRVENLGAQETFLSIKHAKKKFKTKVVKKTDCPNFQERFVIPIKPGSQREDSWLKIKAYEKGIKKKLLAEIALPLTYLEQYSEKAASLKLHGSTGAVSAWLNFQEKGAVIASKPKCRLRYVLFYGSDYQPWETLEANDDPE